MCHVGKIGPHKVARETTEVRIERKSGEFMFVVTQNRAIHHQVHEHTDKGTTFRWLKHWTTYGQE